MGFLGEEPVRTPHLDRFASQGMVLDSVSATYPVCSPYRAMLMTGKYPFANGVTANCTSATAPYGVELRAQDHCWSDILSDRGYSLGYIGKWHLDSPLPPYIDCLNNRGERKWNEWCPPARRHGFDSWYAYGTYNQHDRPMYWDNDAARDDFHFVDQWGPEHEADRAIAYLKNEDGQRAPGQPFAMVVSMNPPHMPYHLVPDHYRDHYADLSDEELCRRPNIPPAGTEWGDHYRANIRNYYAMISGVDEQFGRILAALDETGLADNTIVVFTSDHGDCLGIHEEVSKNNYYEESIRVPFIIRWPGQIAPGRDDLLLSAPDIYPTLIDLMGFRDDIPETVQGSSHAAVLRGGEAARPTSQFYLHIDPRNTALGRRGVRTATHTFVIERDGAGQTVRLFDHQADPYQLQNIAAVSPEIVRTLTQELNQWLATTADPWSPIVPSCTDK